MTSMDEMRQWAQEARDQVERVNGGAAFPHDARDLGERPANGMTLRDYFAGQAIAGELASYSDGFPEWGAAAKRAYEMADAMLKARANHESDGAA